MTVYILIIAGGAAAILAVNEFAVRTALEFTFGYNLLGVFGSIAAVFAIDLAFAFLCRSLHGKVIRPSARYFRVGKREKRFLERLGVRRFKDWLPDVGKIVKFPKGEIAKPRDKEYLYAYIVESCSGELNHLLSIFFGFLIVFIFPLRYALCFGVPVAAINSLLNLFPLLALRYNRYKLTAVHHRLEVLEQKQQKTEN